jgi:hypothetical protein
VLLDELMDVGPVILRQRPPRRPFCRGRSERPRVWRTAGTGNRALCRSTSRRAHAAGCSARPRATRCRARAEGGEGAGSERRVSAPPAGAPSESPPCARCARLQATGRSSPADRARSRERPGAPGRSRPVVFSPRAAPCKCEEAASASRCALCLVQRGGRRAFPWPTADRTAKAAAPAAMPPPHRTSPEGEDSQESRSKHRISDTCGDP